jgi:hypothetical protein
MLLLNCYRKDDAHNPEVYSAAIASIFEGYSRKVVDRAADPRTGIASQYKFLPAVAEVREFCDREAERQRIMAREPIRKVSYSQPYKPEPGKSYIEMFEKYGRPIGPFEQEDDWKRR